MNMAARTCCGVLVLSLAACDWMLELATADSPECHRPPRVESLVDELAIVRVSRPHSPTEQHLYLDRLKYLAVKDSVRSVNRVVIAVTPPSPEVQAIEWGDTVRVTTRFAGLLRAGGYEAYIPRWSANEGHCWEGAWVAWHRVVSMAPV